jgi:hypothetical protein
MIVILLVHDLQHQQNAKMEKITFSIDNYIYSHFWHPEGLSMYKFIFESMMWLCINRDICQNCQRDM